ncbi:MAG: hypothetical protein PHF24_03585 [Syntrophomonas sp.]|nr:hypothetical protein [Syntrophomonas sp.]
MTRQARKISNTGTYHDIMCGNERKDIFENRDDKQQNRHLASGDSTGNNKSTVERQK